MSEEMIALWRFEKVRGSAVVALSLATALLRQREDMQWMDATTEYHTTMELVATLAKGLHDGTAA